MSLYYAYNTGYPKNVLPIVKRRLSAFTRFKNVDNFKIGITAKPERRWRQAYARGYDEMLVIYRSSSINCVSILERELINHNHGYCDNRIAGGGGDIAQRPPYYLYVVVKYKNSFG